MTHIFPGMYYPVLLACVDIRSHLLNIPFDELDIRCAICFM